MAHIFMILSDELRADALGYMGNEQIKTPNIDALAEDAFIFEKAYCNTPMCVPSRISIATGRYAHSHGGLDNMLQPFSDEQSLYQILSDEGYRTINYGKWHCNVPPESFGIQESDVGILPLTEPEKYVTCFGITDRTLRQQTDYKKNMGEVPLIISGTRPSHKDACMDSVNTQTYLHTLKSIEADGQPTFARLSIMDPHTPYLPSEPYASMYDPSTLAMPPNLMASLEGKPVMQEYFYKTRAFDQLREIDYRKSKAAYYGLVSHVDDRVGQVINQLKDLGLYEDSYIVFLADHGTMMGEHGFVEKWGHMYEPVSRIPLLIKPPKNDHKGKRLDSFVESVDIMPTLLDLLDIQIPSKVQGKSLVPYMYGASKGHKDNVYSQYYCGSLQNESALMIRDERWKLTSYPEGNELESFLPNDHPLKWGKLFEKNTVLGELYDMEADPFEMKNLYDDPSFAQVRISYTKKLNEWFRGLGITAKTDINDLDESMSIHVLKQGNNMAHLRKMMHEEGRTSQLERE